jgi:hypothetical protein
MSCAQIATELCGPRGAVAGIVGLFFAIHRVHHHHVGDYWRDAATEVFVGNAGERKLAFVEAEPSKLCVSIVNLVLPK